MPWDLLHGNVNFSIVFSRDVPPENESPSS